jgi:hypothetical protein
MAGLNVDLNLAAPDDFYATLVELHRGLTDEQSELVNARLILLLANHIGDAEVLREAMRRAREGIEPTGESVAEPSPPHPAWRNLKSPL